MTRTNNARRLALAAALLALAPGAVFAARPPATVSYGAPAGNVPAGHLRGATFDAVLPSGRIVTPLGTSVVTGMNALGMTLTPDGRFAIVSDDDEHDAQLRSAIDSGATGGYTLAVVDVASMRVVDRYRGPGEKFWVGVAALPDPTDATRTLVLASGGNANAVYVLDLDANGHLTRDRTHVVTPGGTPGTIVLARDNRRAYVVNASSGTVNAIDTATRTLSGAEAHAGFAPFGAAVAGDHLVVADEGLMRYAKLADPATAPAFRTVAPDAQHASALSFLGIAANGDLADGGALPLDPAPDGARIVGGAHPSAVVATPDGAYAFVAVTNVDRIATVALRGAPRAVGGTELRLFDRGPYGTQPAALALSKDGSRLYVALAGLNAVAVIDAHDPVHLHRLGLIPTGWYPTALALAGDGRTLYVVNTKGFGHDAGFTGDVTAVWSTLQKIDLGSVQLRSATMNALANTRRVVAAPPSYPKAIGHVVVILEESRTFDALLGDLGAPYGDPSLASFGESATPNLHALARRYGLAVNLFADAEESGAGHDVFAGGMRTLFAARTPASTGSTPDDYPRLGTIFNALARQRIPFRTYGALAGVKGYDENGLYDLDVPAPAVLDGHADMSYPGALPRVTDEQRAAEFVRDYGVLVAQGKQPRFTSIRLSADHDADQVAHGDRALGAMVQYLSHLPSWRQTALFVMPVDAQSGRDHVDDYRTYAIVAGPYAKPHYEGVRHLSTVSVLKTSEQILGVQTPLSLGDLLATDMSDFFTPRGGDAGPFDALQ